LFPRVIDETQADELFFLWSSKKFCTKKKRVHRPVFELQKKKEFIGLCYAWGIFAERGPNTDYSYLIAL